jgi:outer membrane receptor protein involved in Fe transport
MLQALPASEPPQAIIVTASALPTPEAEGLLNVTVIGSEALRTSPFAGLDQIVKGAAGVQLFRRSDVRSGHPTSQGVTLRGLGGNAASRALLVLDGVPQSDPFGGWVNWPAYDPASLAELRVIRGGGSVANGPGALAGAIDLVSRNDPGVTGGLEGGSRSSLDGRLYGSGKVGGGVLALSAYGNRGSGFVPLTRETRGPADRRAPYASAGGRVRWSNSLGASTRIEGSGSGFVDKRERGLAFTGNRTVGADLSVRLLGTGRWGWSLLGYAQRRRFSSSYASTDAQRQEARRVSLQYRVPGRALGWSAELRPPVGRGTELRLGADGRFMRGRSEELTSYVAGLATRDRRSGGAAEHSGLFAEVTHGAGPATISAGGRIDHWRLHDGELREQLLATEQIAVHQRFANRSGWLPTGRLAAGLEVAPGIRLRSAAYLGWRLPTLNELFRPFRAGSDATAANPELDPERLRGIEAGADWNRGAGSVAVTAFANRLTDPIFNVTLGAGPGVFPGVGFVPAGGAYRQRRNVDAIRVHGAELAAAWKRGFWAIDGSASLTSQTVRAREFAAALEGLRPAQTPSLLASAGARWERAGRSAALQMHYVASQYEDDLNRLRLPSAVTVDAYGAWPLSSRLRLVGRAENLFDARVVAGRTADRAVERGTPRTLWIGLRFSDQGMSSSGTPASPHKLR